MFSTVSSLSFLFFTHRIIIFICNISPYDYYFFDTYSTRYNTDCTLSPSPFYNNYSKKAQLATMGAKMAKEMQSPTAGSCMGWVAQKIMVRTVWISFELNI